MHNVRLPWMRSTPATGQSAQGLWLNPYAP